MSDPRADNCKAFSVDAAGKVDGVLLTHIPAPTAQYELIKATLINEVSSQGQTIATVQSLDKANVPARLNCWLCWPWVGWQYPAGFAEHLLPGNTKYPYEHFISNKYNPVDGGPLAICLADAGGKVISDVIGGLGLPAGHHVSFDLVFKERGVAPDPEPEPDDDTNLTAVLARLDRIELSVDKILRHFSAI